MVIGKAVIMTTTQLEKLVAENTKQISEVWVLFRQTDEQMKKTDEQMKKTDEQMKKTDEQMKKTDEEIASLAKEVNEEIVSLAKEVKRVNEAVNGLTDRWGRFIEGYLAPGIPEVFQKRGIPIHETHQRVKAQHKGESMEIDILGVNDDTALIVEVKSNLNVDGVEQALKTIANFKKFFPRYKDCKVLGAVAGIEITSEADKFAAKQGLFVLGQSGETVRILNDEGFRAKEW